MKTLISGIILILLIGIGGLVYRNAVEHPLQPIACPLDTETCPDGTTVARTGESCTFPACPPPNVSLTNIGIAYAVPAGFAAAPLPDVESIAAYSTASATSTATSTASDIVIRRYGIMASSTALSVIQATAVSGTSGAPIPVTSFTSTIVEGHRFTVVPIEQFEGTVDTAFYLASGTNVFRFDAIDHGVSNWTDPNLDITTLPAYHGLMSLLGGLQGI